MPSPATWRIASPDPDAGIAAQQAVIAAIEKELWAGGFDAARLAAYQAAFRHLEQLIEARGRDERHKFVVVIPVADRPRHLQGCLDSLLELCRTFGYGGLRDGRYRKVTVLIADDSADSANIAGNRALARRFSRLGIETVHFGPDEQFALVAALGETERAGLSRMLGSAGREAFSHKGQAVMRNIAYLKLREMQAREPGQRLLFHSVDSDQEFKVKVAAADGDKDVCAVNFFYQLDEIFAASDALVLTGKVVGDPPVSPAVMAGNFLEDVTGFLRQMAGCEPRRTCRHHQPSSQREGEAAYHDMADLFGFKPAGEACRYRCTLAGDHANADCFDHFSNRLNNFFFGEHPTRISYYAHDALARTVQPARTVYAGNYVFRPEGLRYFIPFAALRLRMSGPVLGRLIRAEIGARFVSANLPMLHKRTVAVTGQSEFRPGIRAAARVVELGGEFERQFFGDVMLFTIERLTAAGFPRHTLPDGVAAETLEAVRAEMLEKYNAQRRDIAGTLGRLTAILRDPANWWNRSAAHAAAVGNFAAFVDNAERNFGENSACRERINSAANWDKWRAEMLAAIVRYPEDALAWSKALAGPVRAA